MSGQDPETWMWERARSLLEQADRLKRLVTPPDRPGAQRPAWTPPVDVFETDREIWVVVSLAGVEPERMSAVLESHELVVSAERAIPSVFRTSEIHRLEIPHGRFERRVELPRGRFELCESHVLNGCLFLRLQKLD
jgi:HSP20 family molecular chaperone IbpA